MDRAIPVRTAPSRRNVAAFVAVGLAIYVALLAGSEWLIRRNGVMNPVLKADRAQGVYDWVILGASHAMPLDYHDFNRQLQVLTGRRVINLAAPGAGPLYARFAFDHFLTRAQTTNVLYVVDSFAFRSRQWNEERFSDETLQAYTPLRAGVAYRLGTLVRSHQVDPRALLDYVTGFSKLNNRGRFSSDRFVGEDQFERMFRPSAAAYKNRIGYLYPPEENETGLQARYFKVLASIAKRAKAAGTSMVLVKFPLPPQFHSLLPNEEQFDAALAAFAMENGLVLQDFSTSLPGIEFYADTDHLNRLGAEAFLETHLKAVLTQAGPGG